jgi:hypothetical protein
MKAYPSVEFLNQHIHYDKETGVFTRVKDHVKKKYLAGSVTGVSRPDGYLQIMIDGKIFLAHRLAWLYEFGEVPSKNIDHINGNKKDNRIENLRSVTQAVNVQNIRKTKGIRTHSQFLGVSLANKGSCKEKPYKARIVVNSKEIHLGTFDTEENAHQAYVQAKRKYHEGCTL